MAVPGLQLSGLNDAHDILTREIQLKGGDEWRFEVSFSTSLEIKIVSGSAEIFGTELPSNQKFTFSGVKSAIYTWNGCTIEIAGSAAVEYTAEETPMTPYVNLHFALEKRRGEAEERQIQGPRVLIIGPEDSGKTSLVKVLAGYGVRQARSPMVVNLDPREGLLSVPGTLTATSFSTIMDVEQGFGSSPTSGPSPVPVKLPLVYYYGMDAPEKNTKYYKSLVSRMALAVNSRMEEDKQSQYSGIIIDTSGSVNPATGYDAIQHIVAEFSVNVMVTIGSERLYSDMQRRYQSQPNVTVVKVPKSGGCVDRDESFLQQVQQQSIKQYFFGDIKRTLSPYTVMVEFDALSVYQIVEPLSSSANQSFLPIGHEEEEKPILEKAEITPVMENSLLAVMHAAPNDSLEAIRDSSVMGFLHIAEVDQIKRRIKLLSPVSGRIPAKALVLGNHPAPTFLS